MFDRFTTSARKVMQLARNTSYVLKHDYIGTEQILNGLLKEDQGIAASVLRQAGVTEKALEDCIVSMVTPSDKPPAPGKLPFTTRTKKALEKAVTQAEELRHNYISTEHILLGLLADPDSTAIQILVKLGVNLDTLKQELLEHMGETTNVRAELVEEIKEEEETSSGKKAVDKAGSKKALLQFGRDLTLLAKEGKLDPVIGRDSEIESVLMILARRTKNNPLLLGEPGVGKTAIAEGIALSIASGEAPKTILDYRVIALDLSAMVAGTKYRGQFEERIKAVMQEASKEKVILFIDEIHCLIGAGAAEGAIDASNVLKPALSRGEIKCIGATTLDEYKKQFEKDGALNRRFQKIIVEPPSKDATLNILRGLQSKYEEHHKIKYSDDALKAAVDLSDRYITARYFPDKAIDVIDEAGARMVLETFYPRELKDAERDVAAVQKKLRDAAPRQNPEVLAEINQELAELEKYVERIKARIKREAKKQIVPTVDRAIIAATVAKMTKVPVEGLTTDESLKLLSLENSLNDIVIGQSDAKVALAKALRRTRAGLSDPSRPMGSFLFLGPTGVGKTLLVKAMARILFGSEEALITLDMSEYMEQHSVSRLIGPPPGYVGFEEGGQLTEAVRRQPYAIVLFDEIEKAHSDVFNTLLQILEEGKLTDSNGRIVNFKNTIIVLTSNIGSDVIKSKSPLGFGNSSESNDEMIKSQLEGELNRHFRPEFLNRLDAAITFKQLTKEELIKVLHLEMNKVLGRLNLTGRKATLAPSAEEFLLAKGYNPEMGARPLRRAVETYVQDLLAEEILRGNFQENTTVMVGKDENKEALVLCN